MLPSAFSSHYRSRSRPAQEICCHELVDHAPARVELQAPDLIQDTLKTTRGNRAKAARLLDTTERIVNYKVRHYQIDARRFRS